MAERAAPLLVLGGSGLVGSAVMRAAAARQHPATGTFNKAPLPGLCSWHGDLPSALSLVDEVQPGAVVYAAGLTHVDGCETRVEEAMESNAIVPSRLAAVVRGRPFVYLSTEYVFDGATGPYGEDETTSPLSAYARSKVAGEEHVLAANPRAIVVRTTVVYGPDPQGKSFVSQLRRRLAGRERMPVPRDQVSTPTYSADLADRVLDLLALSATGIWHVAGPALMDRYAFARLAAGVFGLDASLLDPVTTADLGQAAARPLHAGLSIDRLRRAFGPETMRSPEQGLADFAASERTVPV